MIMSGSKVNTDQCVNIGEYNIELVNSFVYLESSIMYDDNELSEIQRRLRLILADNVYYSLTAVIKARRYISLSK